MKLDRADVPRIVSELLGNRPTRWSAPGIADYDGRERTLEVFEAEPAEQRELLRALRPRRADLAAAAGGPLVFVFHTSAESRRLHAAHLESWSAARAEERLRAEQNTRLAALVGDWIRQPAGEEPALDPDDIEPIDLREAA